jgi:hypothetical protein
MKRRDFFNNSMLAVLAAIAYDMPSLKAAQKAFTRKPGGAGSHKLAVVDNPELVIEAYAAGRRGLGASEVPYVYAYFDEASKKFVSPLDITPKLDAAAYTVEATLHAFNIRKADQIAFNNLKNQVQLGFNATAPVTTSDRLTWLFMNAVDIFFAKDSERPDQLTKFQKNTGPGTALQAKPEITVTKGLMSLQVTAFGQRRDGFWRKFIDTITAVAGSPIISEVSKGFGIPSLATDALKFVDHVVDVFAEQEKLVPLWSTGSLEFAIHKGADARFRMNPGLWVTVDADYARRSNFLEGHRIDLQLQSFRITDTEKKPIDANYLVSDIKFTA